MSPPGAPPRRVVASPPPPAPGVLPQPSGVRGCRSESRLLPLVLRAAAHGRGGHVTQLTGLRGPQLDVRVGGMMWSLVTTATAGAPVVHGDVEVVRRRRAGGASGIHGCHGDVLDVRLRNQRDLRGETCFNLIQYLCTAGTLTVLRCVFYVLWGCC